MNEIDWWLQGRGFNWDEWFDSVIKLEVGNSTPEEIRKLAILRKDELKHKITGLISANAYNNSPLSWDSKLLFKHNPFDVVSVCFCPESATNKEEDYLLFMRNITNLVRPRGYIVMASLENAKYYDVGKSKFPAFPVKENYLISTLENLNFRIIGKVLRIPPEHNQGYDGMICLVAQKK